VESLTGLDGLFRRFPRRGGTTPHGSIHPGAETEPGRWFDADQCNYCALPLLIIPTTEMRFSVGRRRGETFMHIAEIMSAKTEWTVPGMSLSAAARKMRDLNIGSLPVLADGQLVGIVTDRDICCRGIGTNGTPAKLKVNDVMSRDVATCFEDQEIAEAARVMQEKHVRRLAVLDREWKMVGLLSVDDLAHCSHDLAGEVLAATSPVH
jgi:CBS domain-containing protein